MAPGSPPIPGAGFLPTSHPGSGTIGGSPGVGPQEPPIRDVPPEVTVSDETPTPTQNPSAGTGTLAADAPEHPQPPVSPWVSSPPTPRPRGGGRGGLPSA